MDFKEIHPDLKKQFDMTTLYDRWDPGANLYTGFQPRPGLITCIGPLNPDLAQAFATELRQLAEQNVPEGRLSSIADVVYQYMARLGLQSEADFLYDPTIGRPGMAFGETIGFGGWLNFVRSNYNSGVWATPEIRRGTIAHFMTRQPGAIIENFARWFEAGSAGWLNADERQGALEAIQGATSSEAHEGFLTMWLEEDGEESQFQYWWKNYLTQMELVSRLVRELKHQQDVRRGYSAYEEKLNRLRIGHTIDDIWEWAKRQYDIVEYEMNRIASRAGYEDWRTMLKTHQPSLEAPALEGLVNWYQEMAPDVIQTLIDNGLIPEAKGFGYNIIETPPDLTPMIPIAACQAPAYQGEEGEMRNATFFVTVTNDPQLVRDHLLSARFTIAHEIGGHSWGGGLAPMVVPLDYSTNGDTRLVGLEGVAFNMELAFAQCEGINPTPGELVTMLQGRAWRYARILAECEWHLGEDSLPEIVERYRNRSNISPEMAQRDMRRAAQEIWEFVAYAFGASGVAQMANHYEGGFMAALADYQESTAGLVPPHLYLEVTKRIDRAEQFNWLCEEDPAVLLTRQLVN